MPYLTSVLLMKRRVLEELNDEIRKHIGIIFKITDCIGIRSLKRHTP